MIVAAVQNRQMQIAPRKVSTRPATYAGGPSPATHTHTPNPMHTAARKITLVV
jgi:hypothetical protein